MRIDLHGWKNSLRLVFVLAVPAILFSCGGPVQRWRMIEPNLYLFRDCANVYALVEDNKACFVGFASGRALDHLKEIGADRLDLVLVTHHHRDGLQGIERAIKNGAAIVIPAAESPYIEFAGRHWQEKRIFLNYEGRSRFNAITFDVPVSRRVVEGDVIKWGSHAIRVMETPGHTDGSISYQIDLNGKNAIFTGDFYTAPGKTFTYHDLHWEYNPGPGLSQAINSAEKLKAVVPALVMPEHGDPFEETGAGLERLAKNLKRINEILRPNRKTNLTRKPLDAFGSHIVFLDEYVTYAIISNSRHAIIYDPGYCGHGVFQEFIKKYQIESVDAITFSHYHDDHVARTLEFLYRWQRGTSGPLKAEVWVFETMADVFAHPERYNIPCLFPSAIPIDRVIADGEAVDWEGLKLTFRHFPGQTWYHTVVLFEADGHRYALSGDSIWEPGDRTIRMNGPVIPRNRYFLNRGYETVFQILLDYGVDTIVPAHYDPFPVTRAELQRSLEWAKSIEPAIAELVDQPHPGYGLDPLWAHFYPYRVAVDPDTDAAQIQKVSLLIQNYFDRPVPVEAKLIVPDGVKVKAAGNKLILPPEMESSMDFELEIEPAADGRRRVILADITLDNRYLGQAAEMVIDTPLRLPTDTLK